MIINSSFKIWNFLKEDYKIKVMQSLNLIREFEMQKTKEFETIKDYANKLFGIANRVRLLGSSFFDSRIVEKILVTIPIDLWGCKMSSPGLFSKFKCIRVLSLCGCSNVTGVPDFVGNLKLLCSLDLSFTNIKKLPDSTCSLDNLQILKLNYCHYLEELPSDLYKLTNLRCLEFEGGKVREVPLLLGKLENLQVLSTFYVGKSSEFGIQKLGELNLRGSLSIKELQNIENPSDALAADLKNKIHLMNLTLGWNWNQIHDDPRKEREVLEHLKPSKHLGSLLICNYGGTQFPIRFFDNSLSNMVHLSLIRCKYCLCLPPLGRLPFLKKLVIDMLDGIVSIDANFYGSSSSSFTCLEELEFHRMKEWEEWECKTVTGAFPRLQRLVIKYCPKLKGHLPEQLLCLKTLIISYSKQLVASAPKVPEICELELDGCGKVQFDYHPTTLKRLLVGGQSMEASSVEMIGHIISNNTCLESLKIICFPNMNIVKSYSYDFLVRLEIISSCESLVTFPLDFFPKLHKLYLTCHKLQMISQEQVHNQLKYLTISECPGFESFPCEGLSAPSLEEFIIAELVNLKSLPACMHILLPSLGKLCVENCPKLESFPDEGLPSNLTSISISNGYKLIASLKGALGANTSLKSLSIKDMDVEFFPGEGLLPLFLKFLNIYNCPNLKILNFKSLCYLSSLEKLILQDIPSLQCLPEEGLPKSISTLHISGSCPLLKQCCLKPKGKNWEKIVHIKNIFVDGEPVQ